MKNGVKIGVCLVTLSAAIHETLAVTETSNPYERIVARNVFGLKPPTPVQPPTPPPPEVSVPKITLQGITSILGMPQVLFKAETPAKPGQQAEAKSYMLAQGEAKDDIEVLAIDFDARSVKFKNHDLEQLLNMATDAAKPSGGGGAPAPGAHPGSMPTPQLRPGTPPPVPGMRNIPTTRERRIPQSDQGEGGTTGANSRVFNPASQNPLGLSGDEQQVIIEANRAVLQAQGDETAILLPNTEFGNALQQEQQQQEQQQQNQPAGTPSLSPF